MSSLSGALDESALKKLSSNPLLPDDIEMQPESTNAASESEGGGEDEQDEEMADLFGNEDVQREPKYERFEIICVLGDMFSLPFITGVQPRRPQPQHQNQTGFRPPRGTADRHLNMKRMRFPRIQAR